MNTRKEKHSQKGATRVKTVLAAAVFIIGSSHLANFTADWLVDQLSDPIVAGIEREAVKSGYMQEPFRVSR